MPRLKSSSPNMLGRTQHLWPKLDERWTPRILRHVLFESRAFGQHPLQTIERYRRGTLRQRRWLAMLEREGWIPWIEKEYGRP